MPAPWSDQDVGAPVLSGSATFSNGIFTIDAGGRDIWDSSDQFHFVFQPVSGDIDVRARVDSVAGAHAWSKAGVMIRSSLAANAAHGYAFVSAGRGVAFQRRQSVGGNSTHTSGTLDQAPHWVRLVRAGTRLTAFQSPDGVQWTMIGSDTVALGTTAYVGIAVTSHHPGMRTTAAVSNVAITRAGLPDGQASGDIGRPAIAGSTSYAAGRYTISAGGLDVWGTADQFHYVYQPVSGNVEVVARVQSLTPADRWSKAGIMVRESLAAGSKHADALASVGRGYAFQRRPQTDGLSEHTSGGAGAAPVWLRLVRSGDLFEAYRSADGAAWTPMGSATIAMGETVYVGIAVTSHSASVATTAVVDGLRVTAATAGSNQSPAVLLSAPANGATFVAPATVTMTAAATDPDGTIAGVDFYADSTLLARDTSAPYSFTVSSLAAGTYTLRAVATDNAGASAISDPVAITVTAGGSTTVVPRWVDFQASPDHETLVTHYVLEVYGQNATPGMTAPFATSDLGKPAPSSTGEITVDRYDFFMSLPPGTYLAAVLAVGDGVSARSAAVTFTR